MEKMTSLLRLRMSAKDAHYGGNLVDGAHMVHLFGDVATELLIKCDGDEGLFCAYDNVEFLAPVYAGDYIEAYGEIEKITDNTSFLTGGTLTTELAYTYNDFGLPVKLTYTDVDGETRTVREETNLTYDGNGNILTEAVTEAYSGSTTCLLYTSPSPRD